MKRHLLFLVLFAKIVASAFAAPTAKAIYCASNTTLYFTYDEVTYNTSTAYEQLDGNTPTKIYDNISSDGYTPGGYQCSILPHNTAISSVTSNTPWCKDYRLNITTVKFLDNIVDWRPTRLSSYFFCLENLSEIIGADKINTSELTSLISTFDGCKSLTDFSFLSGWDVSNITNLARAFKLCVNLTDFTVFTNWDVSNVKSLMETFMACRFAHSLTGLEDWNVSNVTSLQRTFLSCDGLTDLDPLLEWDVSNVTSLFSTFNSCTNLENIDGLKDWNVSKVENMYGMFMWCDSLTKVDGLSEWDTGNVINMRDIFDGCNSLEDLEGLRKWDTKNVKMLFQAFSFCSHLKTLEPIYEWDTSSLTDLTEAFAYCYGLVGRVDLSKWDLSHLNSTATITFSGQDPQINRGQEILSKTFYGCSNIIGITLGHGNIGDENFAEGRTTEYATFTDYNAISNTFQGCNKLRYIDFSGCTDTYGNIIGANRTTNNTMFNGVPRTCVVYLPKDNGQPNTEKSEVENIVYTAANGTLQCDKYYSEDKVDIELPHRFHADAATYERTFNSNYGGVILPYPVKINDTDDEEFQPFLLKKEYTNAMYFEGKTEVDANTPFVFKRKGGTSMTFPMSDVWVESTYDVDGQTTNNIELDAWNAQGFYTTHEIEPENGKFGIPTKDDYKETSIVEYDYDRVYYIAGNKFYRADNSTLYLDPHRIVFYGMWDKYTGGDSSAKPYVYDIEEMDSQVVTAIEEAEVRMDEENAVEIYDASGNRLSKTQRGLNILRMSDGSIKKVIKK